MDHISTLLLTVLRKRGLKDQADASLIVHAAQRWLSENGLETVVTTFSGRTITIEVASSVAAEECRAATQDLLSCLTQRFPEAPVETVRILRGAA